MPAAAATSSNQGCVALWAGGPQDSVNPSRTKVAGLKESVPAPPDRGRYSCQALFAAWPRLLSSHRATTLSHVDDYRLARVLRLERTYTLECCRSWDRAIARTQQS